MPERSEGMSGWVGQSAAMRRLAAARGMAHRIRDVAGDEGMLEVRRRAVRAAYLRFGGGDEDFPLHPHDVASSQTLDLPRSMPVDRSRPLTVGWLTSPPGAGSGGHTTMFRMVEAVERAGHTCVLLICDRYGGALANHTAVIRENWPAVQAEIRDVSSGFDGIDCAVATSWPTAHVLASRCRTPMGYLYLVQDYEPFFYPRGSLYALAEDTYRFGFQTVSIGHMVADVLRAEAGVESAVAEFGCDTDVYRLDNEGERSGVVFYTKPGTPRRGFSLGMLALEHFHERMPDQQIHLIGQMPGATKFPAVKHGRMTPSALNDLYNTVIGGFAMSFTNISLITEEMLAAGAIPVVNDSALARADLENPHVVWTPPTPAAMSDALTDVVCAADIPAKATSAASSVRATQWRPAQETFVRVLEEQLYA